MPALLCPLGIEWVCDLYQQASGLERQGGPDDIRDLGTRRLLSPGPPCCLILLFSRLRLALVGLSLVYHFTLEEALPTGVWQAARFIVLGSLELDFVHRLQWGKRKYASITICAVASTSSRCPKCYPRATCGTVQQGLVLGPLCVSGYVTPPERACTTET